MYRLVHAVGWPVFRVWAGFTVRGLHHVPRTGGLIVASNHASYLDPLLVGCAVAHRPLYIMAKEELFKVPLFGPFIRLTHAVPVSRGAITRVQLRTFHRILGDEGKALLMFPEGTRSTDGRLGAGLPGVGALCRALRVPVVPVLVQGSYDLWPRSRRLPRLKGNIEVRFGPPVEWADDELNATGNPSGALAGLIMARIGALQQVTEEPAGFWSGYRSILWRPRSTEGGGERTPNPPSGL